MKSNLSYVVKLGLFFIVLLYNLTAMSQDVSYPYPPNTVGGSNGKLLIVNNLSKQGKGSLTEALRTVGARTIRFDVGGTIDMEGEVIYIKEAFLSVLGQTAPSPGITIINGCIVIETNDVIIQHVRFRTGSQKINGDCDVLTTSKNSYNVVIDHCSLMWGVDENLSASGPQFNGDTPSDWRKNTSHRIVFSNNIIGEALSNSIHIKGEHSMGTLIHDNVSDVIIFRNLYISNNDRNPLFKGGTTGVILNNLIVNPGIRAISFALVEKEWEGKEQQVTKLSVIGNVVEMGRNTYDSIYLFESIGGPLELYMDDNILMNIYGNKLKRIYKGEKNKLVLSKPFWYKTLEIIPADKLKNFILQNVGARPWDRDEIDLRILNEVVNKTAKIRNDEI